MRFENIAGLTISLLNATPPQITAIMIKSLAFVLSALSLADASLLRRTRRVAFAGRIVDPVEEEERYVNSEYGYVEPSTVK